MAEKPAIRTVIFPGVLSSHKNKLHPRRDNKGFYLDQKVKKEREALILYLKSLQPIGKEWSVRCEIVVDLASWKTGITLLPTDPYSLTRHPDLDGQAVAILDACQKAGVIFNDNRVTHLLMSIK